MDTEIPIIKQSPSPPPHHQHQLQHHQQQSLQSQQQPQHQQHQQQQHQSHRTHNIQIKTEQQSTSTASATTSSNGSGGNSGGAGSQQISHRPLLHNLLSGAPIHTTPYHRNYCTSSTGILHKTKRIRICLQIYTAPFISHFASWHSVQKHTRIRFA